MKILIVRDEQQPRPAWQAMVEAEYPADSITLLSGWKGEGPDVVILDSHRPAPEGTIPYWRSQAPEALLIYVGLPENGKAADAALQPGDLPALRQALRLFAESTPPPLVPLTFIESPSSVRAGLTVYQFDDLSDVSRMRLISRTESGIPRALSGDSLEPSLPALLETSLPQHFAEVLISRQARTLGEIHTDTGEAFSVKAFPLTDASLAVLWEDITEQKKLDDRKRRIEEHLLRTRKMEAIARLAGGVAHDFNNLMTAIMGYSDLIMSELPAEDPIRPDMEEIQRATERATFLTRQLSSLNPHKISQARKIDLNVQIESFLPKLEGLVGRSVQIFFCPAASPSTVLIDADDLQQVLVNLLMNAKDAMPKGGTFSIDLSCQFATPDSEHLLTLGLLEQSYVEIRVSDTGVGMEPATQERIFEPFFTTRAKARGLGLTTVFGIIKQAEGAIEVHSRPQQGTTFTIHLPRCEAVTIKEVAPGPRPAQSVVLLAEDEEMLGELMGRILKRRGFRVLAAANGAEALKIAQEFPGSIDLLITDVVMPQVSGIELAAELRKTRPETKVLFISGYTDARIIQRDLRIDLVDFMHKPFTPEVFEAKVHEVLVR